MRAPFEISDPSSAITDYLIRLENALHDRAYLHDEEMYFVIDNYILFCLFLEDSNNLESFCANSFYGHDHDHIRFVVLPESLWELRRNIDDTANAFNKRVQGRQSWTTFFREPHLKQFLALMEEPDRSERWPAIIDVLGKMMEDSKQRSYILAVLEFGRIRDFAAPLTRLARDVSRGKVCTLLKLAQAFGVDEIQVKDDDRMDAYRLLSRFRGRHLSDVVDALVYAKVKTLNEVAKNTRNGCVCRFFSHETMIDMLEQSIPQVGRRYVRSLTDSLLLLKEEAIGADEIQEVVARLRHARDNGRGRKQDRGALLLETYKAGDELRGIRERLLHDNKFSRNLRSEDLHSLLQLEAERFAGNLRKLARENRSVEAIKEEYRKQIEDLYRAINNFRNADATLDDFMAPVETAAKSLWGAIDGDHGQVEDLIIQCLAVAKPTDDIRIYLDDVGKHDLDPRKLIDRIRHEVLPDAVPDLWAKLSDFVKDLAAMAPRQRSGTRPATRWKSEAQALVGKLAGGGVPVLESIIVLVERVGNEAREHCHVLIEEALEREGSREIYTEALLRIARVAES